MSAGQAMRGATSAAPAIVRKTLRENMEVHASALRPQVLGLGPLALCATSSHWKCTILGTPLPNSKT